MSEQVEEISMYSHWNYDEETDHGPKNWRLFYPNAGGLFQSPINIETSNVNNLSNIPSFSAHVFANCAISTILKEKKNDSTISMIVAFETDLIAHALKTMNNRIQFLHILLVSSKFI